MSSFCLRWNITRACLFQNYLKGKEALICENTLTTNRSSEWEETWNHLGETHNKLREETPERPPEPQARASICGELSYNSAGFQIKRTLQKASASQRMAWIVRIVQSCLGCRQAHIHTDVSKKKFLFLIQKVYLWIIKYGRPRQALTAEWMVSMSRNIISLIQWCSMRWKVQTKRSINALSSNKDKIITVVGRSITVKQHVATILQRLKQPCNDIKCSINWTTFKFELSTLFPCAADWFIFSIALLIHLYIWVIYYCALHWSLIFVIDFSLSYVFKLCFITYPYSMLVTLLK